MADNAAITALEYEIQRLRQGGNSIPMQKEKLARLKEQIKVDEKNLANDKKALLEMEEALELLKAGEE